MLISSIKAQAAIIFDFNDSLLTNVEVNIVDADPSQTDIFPIISAIDSSHLFISWSSSDVGSGV